jgi:LPXTG-motif cell wall-anchored protein
MRVARIPLTMVVALLAATTLVAIAPSASAASPYPGNGCTVTISQVHVVPGSQLSVTATGYPAGSQVTFVLQRPGNGTPPPNSASAPVTLGTVTADASGTATLVFTMPNVHPGLWVIVANGVPLGNCDPDVSTNVMVDAATVATTSTGSGTLPRTGTNSAELVQLALVLIAVGGLITLATRKRRQQSRVGS